MILRRAAAIALLAILGCITDDAAHGHHSYPATYDFDKTIEIRGELVVFMYRNPHSLLQVMVRGRDGKDVRWACEWAGTRALNKSGVGSGTLSPGDEVIISGFPGRNENVPRMLVRSIHRSADGWKWSGDSSE